MFRNSLLGFGSLALATSLLTGCGEMSGPVDQTIEDELASLVERVLDLNRAIEAAGSTTLALRATGDRLRNDVANWRRRTGRLELAPQTLVRIHRPSDESGPDLARRRIDIACLGTLSANHLAAGVANGLSAAGG